MSLLPARRRRTPSPTLSLCLHRTVCRAGSSHVAGGCFWSHGARPPALPVVISTTSGYNGGAKKIPLMKRCPRVPRAREVVAGRLRSEKVSYERLSKCSGRTSILPYETAVLRHRQPVPHRDLLSHRRAETSRRGLQRRLAKTETVQGRYLSRLSWPAGEFLAREDYHQDFYVKNPEVQVLPNGSGATPG